MAKSRRKSTTTVKKKMWVPIMSPENTDLGETNVEDPQTLVGRKMKVNLMNLLEDPRKRKYNAMFKITGYDGNIATTRIVGYETQPTSIKMMIRKRHDRVDDRHTVTTADKEKVVIKPLLITRNNVPKSVMSNLRLTCRAVLERISKKLSTDILFKEILTLQLQKNLKKELSKVYPLKGVEIKMAFVDVEREGAIRKKKVKPVEDKADNETIDNSEKMKAKEEVKEKKVTKKKTSETKE